MPPTETTAVRALVVEDEAPLRDELCEALAAAWPALDIVDTRGFDGETDAAAGPEQRAPWALLFLDIRIPDPDGLEVARLVGDRVHVVFVTAYDKYALAAFERGAVDYLLKPLQPERLARVVQRLQLRDLLAPATARAARCRRRPAGKPRPRPAAALADRHCRPRDALHRGRRSSVLPVRRQVHARVALADSEVLIRRTLKELIAELDPEQFWQTHRSTVVNALEVASVEPNMAGKLTLRLKRRRDNLPVSDGFMRRFVGRR